MGLKENTTKLNALLEKANSLPDDDYYNRFWDSFQENGNRTNYAVAFGSCWNKDNFKPKYSLRPTNAYMMFFNNTGSIIDLGEVAEDYFNALRIELDFSKAINVIYGIAALHAKRFKKLDFSSATNMGNLFYSHGSYVNCVEEIDEFISSEITTYDNSTFQQATHLREIRFTGVIAKGVINFQWNTKLSKASITSLINVLSPNTSGLTCTLSQTAVNNAFTNEERVELFSTKPNWTISLA